MENREVNEQILRVWKNNFEKIKGFSDEKIDNANAPSEYHIYFLLCFVDAWDELYALALGDFGIKASILIGMNTS